MIFVDDLKKAYADKLVKTGSQDAAFLKAVWLAYKQGVADEAERRDAMEAERDPVPFGR